MEDMKKWFGVIHLLDDNSIETFGKTPDVIEVHVDDMDKAVELVGDLIQIVGVGVSQKPQVEEVVEKPRGLLSRLLG